MQRHLHFKVALLFYKEETVENTPEIVEVMQERAFAFRFLARAYQTAPDLAFIDSILSVAQSDDSDSLLASFYQEAINADKEQLRIDLAADYNRLFLGMSANPVSPYESVYTSEERMLMQESRDDMVRIYNEMRVKKPDTFNLPEDHISLELELVAILAERIVEALSANDIETANALVATTQDFESNHLAWITEFCDNVTKQATTSFYQALADMTKETIEADKELLTELA